MLCNRNTESVAPGLKPEAAASGDTKVVTEEPVGTDSPIAGEYGTGVLDQTVADVHAHERAAGGHHLQTSTDIEREERAASCHGARERRRKNQNARDRPRGSLKTDDSRSQSPKWTNAAERWTCSDAGEHFNPPSADRWTFRKISGMHAEFSLEAEEGRQPPSKPAADADVSGVELARHGREKLDRDLES